MPDSHKTVLEIGRHKRAVGNPINVSAVIYVRDQHGGYVDHRPFGGAYYDYMSKAWLVSIHRADGRIDEPTFKTIEEVEGAFEAAFAADRRAVFAEAA